MRLFLSFKPTGLRISPLPSLCPRILYSFYTRSFLGCILGTSKDNLSWLGKLVSLFAEVSGQPYGTAIDLRPFLHLLSLSDYLYYIYIILLCIFCTNSINIYAGINGLEVGQVRFILLLHSQSIIIACSLLVINIIDILIGGDAGIADLLS